MSIVTTFEKPYYAVIFSSQRVADEPKSRNEYAEMSEKMLAMAKDLKGFLGVESLRSESGFGITISYWKTEEDIKNWKADGEHRLAQQLGRESWYESYTTRICKIERDGAYIK